MDTELCLFGICIKEVCHTILESVHSPQNNFDYATVNQCFLSIYTSYTKIWMIITINAWKNYDHSYLNIFLCSSNLRSFILHIQLTNFCKSKHKVCNQDGHHYFIFHSEWWRKHSKMEKKTSCTLELRTKSILKDKIGM